MIRISLIDPPVGTRRPAPRSVRISAALLVATLLGVLALRATAAAQHARVLAELRRAEQTLAETQPAAQAAARAADHVGDLRVQLAQLDAIRRAQALPSRLVLGIERSVPPDLWLLEVQGDLTQTAPLVHIEGRALSFDAVTAFAQALRAAVHGVGRVDVQNAVVETVGSHDVVRFGARIHIDLESRR